VKRYKRRTRSPLNEKSEKVGNTSLVEHTQLAIVSLAIPLSDDESVETALQSIMKVSRPAVGQLTHAKGDSPGFSNLLALGLQADQLFLVFDYPETTPVEQVSKSIGEIAYLTDQSDSWVVIDINGPLATTALERICPLDLHDSVMNDTTGRQMGIDCYHPAHLLNLFGMPYTLRLSM